MTRPSGARAAGGLAFEIARDAQCELLDQLGDVGMLSGAAAWKRRAAAHIRGLEASSK